MSFTELLVTINEPALRSFALHWDAARGAKRMPSWGDIDPAAIAPYLPIAWSWKYDHQADSFTGRLAGEEIIAAFGRNLRGVPMADFFADWQYDLIFARHRRVVTEPAFAHGSGPVFVHADRHGVGERIILPLATDGERGDGILGATVYHVESKRLGETIRLAPDAETVAFFRLG